MEILDGKDLSTMNIHHPEIIWNFSVSFARLELIVEASFE